MGFTHRTSGLSQRIAALRAQIFEPGQLVKVAGGNGDLGGIVLAVDRDTREVLVKAWDREVRTWVVYWWPAERLAPMVTGMTAEESREIARALLEAGRLPAQTTTAAVTAEAITAA